MATVCLPYQELDAVEMKIERVNAGLTFSQAMNQVVRACFSLVHLTGAFHEAATGQAELINALLDPRIQGLRPEPLNDLASKLERLVQENESVVESAYGFRFNMPWKGYLETLSAQAERISGIAESFRMAADSAVIAGIVQLSASAADELDGATNDNWREFVATLSD
jgi:hypothetical protein